MPTNKDVAMKKALSDLAAGSYDPKMSKDFDDKMEKRKNKHKKKMSKKKMPSIEIEIESE